MHPYAKLSSEHFWSKSMSTEMSSALRFDPAPKLSFSLAGDVFSAAGSCFAQHFGRELSSRGGRLLIAEQRHPFVDESSGHGYGAFSARYGNIYSTAQLCELLEQAFEVRAPIIDFVQREDGRWIDMLRPRAVPDGFSSFEDCRVDRLYHLKCVQDMFRQSSVFVFTLGLTETWINTQGDYTYGMCPGVAGGTYCEDIHHFKNLRFDECYKYLEKSCQMIAACNERIKILLTVSPVMLVATYEKRGCIQSSVASKSILRAVADEAVRSFPYVDYFPSYEIIAGPQAKGCFFDGSGRDVTANGVSLVMDTFFDSRFSMESEKFVPTDDNDSCGLESSARKIENILNAECDEILLDSCRSNP